MDVRTRLSCRTLLFVMDGLSDLLCGPRLMLLWVLSVAGWGQLGHLIRVCDCRPLIQPPPPPRPPSVYYYLFLGPLLTDTDQRKPQKSCSCGDAPSESSFSRLNQSIFSCRNASSLSSRPRSKSLSELSVSHRMFWKMSTQGEWKSLQTLTVTSGHSHKTFTAFTSTCRANTLPTLRLTLTIHSPGPSHQEHENIWMSQCMWSSNLFFFSSASVPVTRLIRAGVFVQIRSPRPRNLSEIPESSLLILLRLSSFGGSGTQSRWLKNKMRGVNKPSCTLR